MQIDGILWLSQFVEKLASKHNVTTMEVEEIFANRPRFRFVAKGNPIRRRCLLGDGTNRRRSLSHCFFYSKAVLPPRWLLAREIWIGRSGENMEKKDKKRDPMPTPDATPEEIGEFWDTHSLARLLGRDQRGGFSGQSQTKAQSDSSRT